MLQQQCPACFGGIRFGRPLELLVLTLMLVFRTKSSHRGGDFQLCCDGNFSHRHSVEAGDSPRFYDLQYLIPKSFVDAIGKRIQKVRKSKPKDYKRKVPDEAVADCEDSYHAVQGEKKKSNAEKFNDTGLMALVCRHDIPIFMANIDSPGEQQKYSIVLVDRLFQLIPAEATVGLLYDIGCVLDRSLNLVNLITHLI